MVIELSGVQFSLKSNPWFQNWTVTQGKLYLWSQVSWQNCTTKFSYHIGTFFWNSKTQWLQYKLFSLHKSFIDQVLSWFVKSCKSCHRFSAIWLASLNKPSNLIGCRILVKLSHWLGKRWNSKHEMVWLQSYGW